MKSALIWLLLVASTAKTLQRKSTRNVIAIEPVMFNNDFNCIAFPGCLISSSSCYAAANVKSDTHPYFSFI